MSYRSIETNFQFIQQSLKKGGVDLRVTIEELLHLIMSLPKLNKYPHITL